MRLLPHPMFVENCILISKQAVRTDDGVSFAIAVFAYRFRDKKCLHIIVYIIYSSTSFCHRYEIAQFQKIHVHYRRLSRYFAQSRNPLYHLFHCPHQCLCLDNFGRLDLCDHFFLGRISNIVF